MKKWIIAFFILAISWGIGLFYGIRWRVNYLREANLFCSQNTALKVAAPNIAERIYSYGLDDYKVYEPIVPNYKRFEVELVNAAMERYFYYKAYKLNLSASFFLGFSRIAAENSSYRVHERLPADQWFLVPKEILSQQELLTHWLDSPTDTIVLDSSYTDLVQYFEETKVLSKLYEDWAFMEERLKSGDSKLKQDYEKLARLRFVIR